MTRTADNEEDYEAWLVDETIELVTRELPVSVEQFIRHGEALFKSVDVFDFVPTDYRLLWGILDGLPRGKFCEWGSGFGIATGLAELLGFDAMGIELSPELASTSRELLHDHGLIAPIHCGDYLQRQDTAEVVFVYCWPSQIRPVEQHFVDTAPFGSRLLIGYGQNDIRCKQQRRNRDVAK